MRRQKKLTKRERKALNPTPHEHEHAHIHCIACGRHIDHDEFASSPPLAVFIRCDHGSQFPSCAGCQTRSTELVAEHDRTGKPVATAGAWH